MVKFDEKQQSPSKQESIKSKSNHNPIYY